MGNNNQELLNKIIQAWSRFNKRKAERKNVMAKEHYTRWVMDRVWVVKLLFDIDPEYKPDVPDSSPMSLEETDNLKNALKQAQR